MIVYGIVGYGGLLFAMSAVRQNPPTDRSWAAIRAVIMLPSIFCLGLLMSASGNVTLEYEDVTTNEIGYNVSTTNEIISNKTITTTETDKFILENPVWITVHLMFFLLMIIIFAIQLFNIFHKI